MAIFHLQRGLEDVQGARYPDRILLCDRGTVDGSAHSRPARRKEGFKASGTTLDAELARYDAVIFFESAAVGGASIEGGNPIRNETTEQAVALDRRLRVLWSGHPRFVLVPHNRSFFKKISFGLAALEDIVSQLTACGPARRDAGKKPARGKKR